MLCQFLASARFQVIAYRKHWSRDLLVQVAYCSPLGIHLTARDQSMADSGVKEGRKNYASFLFREWTQQHKHKASSYIKSNDFQSYLTKETAARK